MTVPPGLTHERGAPPEQEAPPESPSTRQDADDHPDPTPEVGQDRAPWDSLAAFRRRREAARRLPPMPGRLAADGLAGRDPLVAAGAHGERE